MNVAVLLMTSALAPGVDPVQPAGPAPTVVTAPCDGCGSGPVVYSQPAAERTRLLDRLKGKFGKSKPGPSVVGCCDPVPCCDQTVQSGDHPPVINPQPVPPKEMPNPGDPKAVPKTADPMPMPKVADPKKNPAEAPIPKVADPKPLPAEVPLPKVADPKQGNPEIENGGLSIPPLPTAPGVIPGASVGPQTAVIPASGPKLNTARSPY